MNLSNYFKHFTKLKVIQALAFLLIPLMLIIVNGGILDSISAYANYTPLSFAWSLSLAGALFLYDGFVVRKRWYNIYLAFALFGVILLNHLEYPIAHYTCAVVFFIGSLFNMVFFSSGKERWFKIITAILVLFGMSGCFIFHWYSIFWAEWIGMFPISIHFVLEAINKID